MRRRIQIFQQVLVQIQRILGVFVLFVRAHRRSRFVHPELSGPAQERKDLLQILPHLLRLIDRPDVHAVHTGPVDGAHQLHHAVKPGGLVHLPAAHDVELLAVVPVQRAHHPLFFDEVRRITVAAGCHAVPIGTRCLGVDLFQRKICTDRRRAQRFLNEHRRSGIEPQADLQPSAQFPFRVVLIDQLVAFIQQLAAAVHLPPERLMLLQHAFHIALVQLGILAQGQIRDLFQLVIFLFPFGGSFHRFYSPPLIKSYKAYQCRMTASRSLLKSSSA